MITVYVSVCSHQHVGHMCKRGCSPEACCSLEYSSPQTSFSGHQDCHGPPRGCTLQRAWPSETLLLQNNRKTRVHLHLKRNTGLALNKTCTTYARLGFSVYWYTFLCYKDLSTLRVNAKVETISRIWDLVHNAESKLGIQCVEIVCIGSKHLQEWNSCTHTRLKGQLKVCSF